MCFELLTYVEWINNAGSDDDDDDDDDYRQSSGDAGGLTVATHSGCCGAFRETRILQNMVMMMIVMIMVVASIVMLRSMKMTMAVILL